MPEHQDRGPLIGHGRTADIFAWGKHHILKLFHEGWEIGPVQVEARISELIVSMGLPVPNVIGTLEDDGRYGVVYERVDGPTLLQQFSKAPWLLHRLMGVFADLHVTMHQHRVPELPSRREAMIASIPNAQSVPDMMKESALEVLGRLPEGDTLCHGDFHPDQIILSKNGPVIIDWITAARGVPAADVARSSLILRLGALPEGRAAAWLVNRIRPYAHARYMARYLKCGGVARSAIDEWRIPVAVDRLATGIPEERGTLLTLIDDLMHRN